VPTPCATLRPPACRGEEAGPRSQVWHRLQQRGSSGDGHGCVPPPQLWAAGRPRPPARRQACMATRPPPHSSPLPAAGPPPDLYEDRVDAPLDAERRSEAVYLYGVDYLSTSDILGYFADYCATFVEWINDSSCEPAPWLARPWHEAAPACHASRPAAVPRNAAAARPAARAGAQLPGGFLLQHQVLLRRWRPAGASTAATPPSVPGCRRGGVPGRAHRPPSHPGDWSAPAPRAPGRRRQ
jgi:hypothetical protein